MPGAVIAAVAGAFVASSATAVIAGVIGAGVAATALGAVVGGLASVVVGAAFTDAPDDVGQQQFQQELRDNLVTVRQPITHWQYIYGRTRVAGALTFAHESADQYFHLIVTYAAHVCEAIEAIQFNDEVVPLDGSGNATGKYAGYVRIQKSLGAEAGQPFPDLVAESEGKWTDAHRQSGRTKIYVRLKFNVDLFPTGVPNITAVIKGKKVYDPRTGLTAWSENASLCQADFLCDPYAGLGCVFAEEIDETQLIAAANIDDESVNLASGGTEARYTLNGAFSVNAEPRATLGRLLTANAGKARYIGGVWRIHPAAYVVPTITLSEGDVRAVPHVNPRLSASDLANRVKGLYVSENNLWQPSDFPPITNATYLAEDENEPSWRELDLPFTKSPATAQRIAKIELERLRQQISVDWPGKFNCYRLQPGDTVKIDFSMLGWSEKVFEVEQSSLAFEGGEDGIRIGADLVLRETASAVFDWASGEETQVDAAPDTNLPNPFSVSAPAGLALSSGTSELLVGGDGTIISRIKVEWMAPADKSVSDGGEAQIQFRSVSDATWIDGSIIPGATGPAWINAVKDGVSYDVRLRYKNSIGVRSAWCAPVSHVVIGKTEKPSNVASLTLAGKVLTWPKVTDPDLDGYRIKFQYGANTEWGTASPMHDGLVTASPYTMLVVPPGRVTIMVRAVDTSGNESQASAYVITDFGDSLVANVVESKDYKAASFPGTITNASIVGGNLQASQTDPFYKADGSNFYGADTAPFYSTNYDGMEWVSTGWTPDLAAVGSNMTIAFTLTGDGQAVEYRPTGPNPFYGADLDFFYGDDAEAFYDAPGAFQVWPGSIVASNQEFQFRVATSAGPTAGELSSFTVSVDVPDKSVKLSGVSIGSSGTRLTAVAGMFNVIQAVNLTLQGGSTAMKLEIGDYSATLGPLIYARDASNALTTATIDAEPQGY